MVSFIYDQGMSVISLQLSAEIINLKRSVMRDLLHIAVDPDIISMAGGLPAGDFLPVDAFLDCINAVINRDGPLALQYSPPSTELKEWIAHYMEARGVSCTPDEIEITNGAQQGLALVSRLFLEPGQPAVIEDLTFTGIQQVTSGRGADIRAVPIDPVEGIDIDAVEQAFQKSPAPRLAVVIPNFHNPLGVCLPLENRSRMAALAAEYGVPLIEDDPYAPMRFNGEDLPAIKSFDEAGNVFYLGSFSKMLAPALRLGWIVAPAELMPKITALRESFDLESSTLSQRVVVEFLNRDLMDPHLENLKPACRNRCQAMNAALEEYLGDIAQWMEPEGGIFLWVTLPDQLDTSDIFRDAIEEKVAYIPGSVFSESEGYHNTMRLNFANLEPDEITEGIRKLAKVVRSHL